ncbi:MAG TPA: hypothetical protein VIG33_15270 [Pseudobdellovibrionaceae bacterium]|jgi:hypothetical protein
MERKLNSFLALGLIFGTFSSTQAAPIGSPQDYILQTKYLCQANGIVVRNKQKLVSNGRGVDEVQFVANAGKNQALMFGGKSEYMILPQVTNGTFTKSLNVLSRDRSGTYKVVQEVDMGETQKTKTNIGLSVKDGQGEARPVSCRIEMEWLKRAK